MGRKEMGKGKDSIETCAFYQDNTSLGEFFIEVISTAGKVQACTLLLIHNERSRKKVFSCSFSH